MPRAVKEVLCAESIDKNKTEVTPVLTAHGLAQGFSTLVVLNTDQIMLCRGGGGWALSWTVECLEASLASTH